MAAGLGQDPSRWVAGPCWPKGHSTAFHAQLQQKRVRDSQEHPALGAPQALLCPAPLRQRGPAPHSQPRIHRPTDRRNKLRVPARTTAPRSLPLRAGAQEPAPVRHRAAQVRSRPAPFPGSGKLKRWGRGGAGGLGEGGSSPCSAPFPGVWGEWVLFPTDAGVEEGGERRGARRGSLRAVSFLDPHPGSWPSWLLGAG